MKWVEKLILRPRKVTEKKVNNKITINPKLGEAKNGGDNDPCWDTHKQVGMKKKGGKMVPNCVPKEEVNCRKRTFLLTQHSGLR